jgi:hypothetical protein
MIPLDRVPPTAPSPSPVPTGSSASRPGEQPDRTVVVDTRVAAPA